MIRTIFDILFFCYIGLVLVSSVREAVAIAEQQKKRRRK